MFAEWLCGICYPRIVKGTYGKVIVHSMNFHKLRFKEARTNLTLESEAKQWEKKRMGIGVKMNPETRQVIGEKAETGLGKKLADP